MRVEPKSPLYLVCISLILIGVIWALSSSKSHSTPAYPQQPYGQQLYGSPYQPQGYPQQQPGAPTFPPFNQQPNQTYQYNQGPNFEGFTLDFNTGQTQGAQGGIKSFVIANTNETVKVLGEFGNTGGRVQSIIEKKIEGAKKFKFHALIWALKSWDNEEIGLYVNEKPLIKFRYRHGGTLDTDPSKQINKCSAIKDKLNIKVQGFGWSSTAINCEFEGEVTNDGKLMIGGKDVTSSSGPYVMNIGFTSTTNQSLSDESFGIQSIKVTSTSTGPSVTEMNQNIPQPINIYVGVPLSDMNRPQQQSTGSTPQTGPSTPPGSAPGSTPATIPARGGEYDPKYYTPPRDSRRFADTTAGYLTDDIMTGKADSMCAKCLSGNQGDKQKDKCVTECVGLSKQKAQNLLARYQSMRDEIMKLTERLKALGTSNTGTTATTTNQTGSSGGTTSGQTTGTTTNTTAAPAA